MKIIKLLILSMLMSISQQMFSTEKLTTESARLYVDGIGNFAVHGLNTTIIGTGFISNPIYPDLFLQNDKFYGMRCHRYEFISINEGIPCFERKEEVILPEGAGAGSYITQYKESCLLFWHKGDVIKSAKFDKKTSSFYEWKEWNLPKDITHPIKKIAVKIENEKLITVYYTSTLIKSTRAPGNWRTESYRPYDAAGVWQGTIGRDGIFKVTCSEEENTSKEIQLYPDYSIYGSSRGLDFLEHDQNIYLITASSFGGIYTFGLTIDSAKKHIVNKDFNAHRHPNISPCPIAYPDEHGFRSSIIASGEGGVYFYSTTGATTKDGRIIYEDPKSLKELNPRLYAGSLITPTIVDWNHDNKLDIVCGNSSGHILFFENIGTNRQPLFTSGKELRVNGECIMINPGYGQDVQGPGESRWGYVGANVYDWNQDGHWDILENDSRGVHTVYMGGKDGLSSPKSIFVDDLELHGTWRCRPGVGKWGDEIAYITLDDQDEIHLYIREDDYNLIDEGKLLLNDGRAIRANWLEAGGKGRLRFEIVDWDGDGIKDLLLATNKHHSIPEPSQGIPWWNPKELKGATVLFLRNCGTELNPSFEMPKQLRYKGELIHIGHHGCGVSAGMIGEITDGLPNIIVGDETGSLYLFERKFLTW